MRKVLVPELQPGCCSRCLSAPGENRDYFIDPGFNTFDGVIYLCNKCIADIAKIAGEYISLDEHEKKRREWIDILQQYHDMKEKYDNLIKEIGETVERAASRDADSKPNGDKPSFALGGGTFSFPSISDAIAIN